MWLQFTDPGALVISQCEPKPTKQRSKIKSQLTLRSLRQSKQYVDFPLIIYTPLSCCLPRRPLSDRRAEKRIQQRQSAQESTINYVNKGGLLKKRLWKQNRQHVALNFKGLLQQEPTVMGFDITAQWLWLPVIVLLRGLGGVGCVGGWQGVLCCLKSAANADVLRPHLSLHYMSRPFAAAGQNWPPFGSPLRGGLLWERFYFTMARKHASIRGRH